jgi:hypothetical protein
MVLENEVNTSNDVTNSVTEAVQKLKSEYEIWQRHQKDSDNMLYVLLENCLEFYYFLRQNEQYESAFKSTCHFKWNGKAKITQLIAKSIFGDNKRASVYARAIETAALQKIGKDGQTSMLAWLQSNGGVNGVIRSENPNKSASSALKDKEEEVGRNAERYGVRCKITPFINEEFKAFPSGDWLFLCSVCKTTGEIKMKWFSQTESLVNSAYAELGSHVMNSQNYKERHLAVEAETAVKRAEAHGAVGDELQRILEKIKNRRAETSSE